MNKQAPGIILLLLASVCIVAAGVIGWRQQTRTARSQQLQEIVVELQLQPLQPGPEPDPALVRLGRFLFFDKELSGNRDISCATCHHPALATTDALPLSIGTGGSGRGTERTAGENREPVGRNAPALLNSGLPAWQVAFWDGSVQAGSEGSYETPAAHFLPRGLDSVLAAQAMFPVTFRDEMRGGWYDVDGYVLQPGASPDGGTGSSGSGWQEVDVFGQPNELAAIGDGPQEMPEIWSAVMDRLLTFPEYRRLFQDAYPDVPSGELGFQHAANALAAFETEAFTFVNSPWNRFLAGEEMALSQEATEGALLFFGEARCATCHTPPLFSDQAYHNIGAPQLGPGEDEFAPLDYGRFHFSGDAADRYAFRTPSLLNVTLTGPWLHNGAYNSLEAVIRHHQDPRQALSAYEGSGLPPALRQTLQNEPVTVHAILETVDPLLQDPPRLSDGEIRSLLAFLEALSDPAAADTSYLIPESVPSGLPVED